MKVAGAITIALIAVGALIAAYLAGAAVEYWRHRRERRRMDRHRKLFVDAQQLINRLAQLTDLDGMLAGDHLSPETKEMVTTWVTRYRNEVNTL